MNWYEAFEEVMQQKAINFTAQSKYLNLVIVTSYGINSAFKKDINDDLASIFMAIIIILAYSALYMGTCSPIHSRFFIATIGVLTIGLSYAIGFSICGVIGWKTSGIH